MARIPEDQLTAFLVENQARFYRLAYSYLKDREEALDAVQTAVCRALEKQDSLHEPEALRTWFYRILVNTCTDLLRQRKRVTFVPPDALEPEIQTIVKLRFYEELSLKEISAVTGWNLSTVKTRLYTGLKKLRVSMEGVEIL